MITVKKLLLPINQLTCVGCEATDDDGGFEDVSADAVEI
jgi:hypothetical protein